MDTFQTELEKNGYAVIPNVLDDDQCKNLSDGFWKYWSRMTDGKIKEDDPTSWKAMYDYMPAHGMLVQHFSIGHMQEIWDLRCNSKVIGVFEKIWNTPDLTVSFDGAATGFPPEITNRGWHRDDWLHLDQSPHRNKKECVQAWLTPLDVGPGDATLQVLKGSHKHHAAFAKHFKLDKDPACKNNWYKLEPKHVDWYNEQGCEHVTIECPKGSMVLWESRTVHAGRGPLKSRPNATTRMVSYISMMPSALLSEQERTKKQNALLQGRHTSHWAAKHVKLFPKFPRTYGRALPAEKEFQPPLLTERGARLAGWRNPEKCPLLIKDPEERKRACLRATTTGRMNGRGTRRKRNRPSEESSSCYSSDDDSTSSSSDDDSTSLSTDSSDDSTSLSSDSSDDSTSLSTDSDDE